VTLATDITALRQLRDGMPGKSSGGTALAPVLGGKTVALDPIVVDERLSAECSDRPSRSRQAGAFALRTSVVDQ